MSKVYIIAWEGTDQSGFGFDWYWNEAMADTTLDAAKLLADPNVNVWQTELEVDETPSMTESVALRVQPLIEAHLTTVMEGPPTLRGGEEV